MTATTSVRYPGPLGGQECSPSQQRSTIMILTQTQAEDQVAQYRFYSEMIEGTVSFPFMSKLFFNHCLSEAYLIASSRRWTCSFFRMLCT